MAGDCRPTTEHRATGPTREKSGRASCRARGSRRRRSKPPRQSLRYMYRNGPGHSGKQACTPRLADGESAATDRARRETLRPMTEGEFSPTCAAAPNPGEELVTDAPPTRSPLAPARRPRRRAAPPSPTSPAGRCRCATAPTSPSMPPCAPPPACSTCRHMAEILVVGPQAADALDYALAGSLSAHRRAARRSTRCCSPRRRHPRRPRRLPHRRGSLPRGRERLEPRGRGRGAARARRRLRLPWSRTRATTSR